MPARAAQRSLFGTHTPCFEISHGGRRLIVDAGTGLSDLGESLRDAGQESLDLLFTHCHWDHIIGLTGFGPIFAPNRRLTFHFGHLPASDLKPVLETLFQPPFFPLPFSTLPSHIDFEHFTPGTELDFEAIKVRAASLNHPGGAVGYRFAAGGKTIAIITDHEHGDAHLDAGVTALCAGADLLIYDAMWDEAVDYAPHRGWGHSTWQAGLDLLHRARAGRLVCVHHDPHASDEDLAIREARLQALHPASLFAREGMLLSLE